VNKIKKLLTVFVLLINIMVFSDQDSIANAIEELDEIFALYQNNKGVDFREAVDRVLKKNTPVGFEHISCQSVELNLRGKLKEKSFGEWLNDVLSFLEIEKEFTQKLVQAGEALLIKTLDHIIIGDNSYFSFSDEGLI